VTGGVKLVGLTPGARRSTMRPHRGSFTLQRCTVDVPDRHDLGMRELVVADHAGADASLA
jgi:hypothetical protein